MSYCRLCMGGWVVISRWVVIRGWVGGWVGELLPLRTTYLVSSPPLNSSSISSPFITLSTHPSTCCPCST